MHKQTTHYFYLHGFASSPRSAKATYFSDRFRQAGHPLVLPDFNQEDFYHLSLSRQLQQMQRLLANAAPAVLIGSSFGGLTAAWTAEHQIGVERLVLLAPAFQFLQHWLPRLGQAELERWQAEQSRSVYHYSEQQMLPLSYGFVTDLAQYREIDIRRPVPTLIFHGRQDDVIPIAASRHYAADRSWVTLVELEDDHALLQTADTIWSQMQSWLWHCEN